MKGSNTVARLETIFSVMTWSVMNALMLAVAFDAGVPKAGAANAPATHVASHNLTA